MPRVLVGNIDTVPSRMISGWARDASNPHHGVELEILAAGGRRIGRVVANWWRPDLAAAGFGTGHHGFEFVPPAHAKLADITLRRTGDGAPLAVPTALRTAAAI